MFPFDIFFCVKGIWGRFWLKHEKDLYIGKVLKIIKYILQKL